MTMLFSFSMNKYRFQKGYLVVKVKYIQSCNQELLPYYDIYHVSSYVISPGRLLEADMRVI